jgi:hypothetical protein
MLQNGLHSAVIAFKVPHCSKNARANMPLLPSQEGRDAGKTLS